MMPSQRGGIMKKEMTQATRAELTDAIGSAFARRQAFLDRVRQAGGLRGQDRSLAAIQSL